MIVRFFDISIAVVGLLVTFPLLIILLLFVWIDTGSSPIFTQNRIGRFENVFRIYKLRSMPRQTPSVPTHEVCFAGVSRLGLSIRRYKIDEIPQLVNVLIGDMSIVGPRPCLPSQLAVIKARRKLGVYSVRPGITGFAQIQKIDMSDPKKLVESDRRFVQNFSIALYCWIILKTITGSRFGGLFMKGGL